MFLNLCYFLIFAYNDIGGADNDFEQVLFALLSKLITIIVPTEWAMLTQAIFNID